MQYTYVGPPNLFYPSMGISPVPGEVVEIPELDHPSFVKVPVTKTPEPKKPELSQEDTDGVRN